MHKKYPCHFTSSSKWCFLGTHAGPKEGLRIRGPGGGQVLSNVVGLLPLPGWNKVDGSAKIWEGLAPSPLPPAPTALPMSTKKKNFKRSCGSSRVVICKTSFSCHRCLCVPLSLAHRTQLQNEFSLVLSYAQL